jgi:hypothetical protein
MSTTARTRLFGGLFVLAVAAAAALATLAVTDGSAKAARTGAATTMTFRAHEVIKPRPIDIAKSAGPSIGDEVIEKEILYANGKRIGYDLIHFTAGDFSKSGPDVIAQGVLVLKDGTINFLGETTFEKIRVAVVGGTGAYQQTVGELTVLRTLKNGDDIDSLRLVRLATAP